MTQEEAAAIVREKIKEEKLKCYSLLESMDDASPEQLKYSGFGGKTNAEAIHFYLKRSRKEIAKIIQEHINKYPD